MGLPYAVVGCKRCEQLWLVDDAADPDRVQCPRCGRRHRRSKLRSWTRSDSPEALEDERASLLAKDATDVGDDVQTFGLDADSFGAVRDRVREGLDVLEPTALVSSSDSSTEFEQLLEARVQDGLEAAAPAPIEATHTPTDTNLQETSLVDEADRPDRDAPTRREGIDGVQTGVRLLTPGDDAPLAPVQRELTAGTRRREWLPALVEALLPTLSRAVRREVAARDPDALDEYRRPRDAGALLEELHRAGVVATDGVWASKLLTYAVRYVDDDGEETLPANDDVLEDVTDRWRAAHERRRQQLREDLLAPGTGQGTHPAGLEELRAGFLAAFDHLVDVETVVRVRLQPEAWGELTDPRTAERSLEALADVARVARVRLQVSSRPVATTLTGRFSAWLEAHVDLTPLRESYRLTQPTAGRDAGEGVDTEAVDAVLDELSDGAGKTRLVAALGDDDRSVRALKDDPSVSEVLVESSVDVFLSELEADGVVTVDRRSGSSNIVSLTPLGAAVAAQISPDHVVRDLLQSSLTTALGQPANFSQVQCDERSGTREGSPEVAAPEDWLADTGDPDEGADYVQWLRPLSPQVDAWVMQKRVTAAAREPGVTLVDDRIATFEDGRVRYIGGLDDELLVQLQGVTPLGLLAGLSSALLSDNALGKVLDVDRVGEDLEQLHGGAEIYEEWKHSLEEVLRYGQQIGWFSEDQESWGDLRDRLKSVKNVCLERVAELAGTQRWEERSELFRRLQGLIATTTALYWAADVEVTVNVRVPDVANLLEDELLTRDFLDFFKYTVPKQAVYSSETGAHSFWRQTLETREEKLQQRLSPGYDDADPLAEPTVSWVVTGPSVTELQGSLRSSIEAGLEDELRDQVAAGEEGAPALEIPVEKGTTYGAIKGLVRELTHSKGYAVARSGSMEAGRVGADLDRLTRLFIRCLATEDRPHECSPISVAHALLVVARSSKTADYLQVRDVEYGLSQLPPGRLFPDHRATVTSFYQAILAAKEPVGREEIVAAESTPSGRTYRRRLEELEEFETLGLLEARSVEGRRRWTASVQPWWEEGVHREKPPEAPAFSKGSSQTDVLFELACAAGLDVDGVEWMWPQELAEIYAANEELRRWRAYLNGVFTPPGEQTDSPPPRAVVGRLPDALDEQQLALAKNAPIGTDDDQEVVDELPSYPERPTPKSPEGGVGRSE